MEQLDERGKDRLCAVERQRDMAAVIEPTKYDTADRDRVDATLQIAHATQQRGQHRQQWHPLAVDLDAEIERKPPAASLAQRGVPIAAAVDDAGPELRVDLDLPAVLPQHGHGVVNKIGPRRRVMVEAEREQPALALRLREVGR